MESDSRLMRGWVGCDWLVWVIVGKVLGGV